MKKQRTRKTKWKQISKNSIQFCTWFQHAAVFLYKSCAKFLLLKFSRNNQNGFCTVIDDMGHFVGKILRRLHARLMHTLTHSLSFIRSIYRLFLSHSQRRPKIHFWYVLYIYLLSTHIATLARSFTQFKQKFRVTVVFAVCVCSKIIVKPTYIFNKV